MTELHGKGKHNANGKHQLSNKKRIIKIGSPSRKFRDRLQKLGYRVDLAPVDFENYCVLEMCGHEVFRCNIKNLSFNTPLEYDVVGQRAVDAVVESSSKFKRARSYLWFWTLLEENMFRNDKFGPKDYWPHPINLPPISSCFTCELCNQRDIENYNKYYKDCEFTTT